MGAGAQTVLDLGRMVKSKYPDYADMSDLEVGRSVKAKYPNDYGDFSDVGVGPPPPIAAPNPAYVIHQRGRVENAPTTPFPEELSPDRFAVRHPVLANMAAYGAVPMPAEMILAGSAPSLLSRASGPVWAGVKGAVSGGWQGVHQIPIIGKTLSALESPVTGAIKGVQEYYHPTETFSGKGGGPPVAFPQEPAASPIAPPPLGRMRGVEEPAAPVPKSSPPLGRMRSANETAAPEEQVGPMLPGQSLPPVDKFEMNRMAHARAQELELPGSPAGKSGHAQLSQAAKDVYGVKSWGDLDAGQMKAIHQFVDKYHRMPRPGEIK